MIEMSLNELWEIRNMAENLGFVKAILVKIVEKIQELEKD